MQPFAELIWVLVIDIMVPAPTVVRDPVESVQPLMEGSWLALHSHWACQHCMPHIQAALVRSRMYIEDKSSLPVIVNAHTHRHTGTVHTHTLCT